MNVLINYVLSCSTQTDSLIKNLRFTRQGIIGTHIIKFNCDKTEGITNCVDAVYCNAVKYFILNNGILLY